MLEVIKRTNCTVIENQETGEWFLTLCGGGMDLSQDIALAYHILENGIPYELCQSVYMQERLSICESDWEVLRKAMVKSLKLYEGRVKEKIEKWNKKIEVGLK